MQYRILQAFRAWWGTSPLPMRPQADFEHGQWWITDLESGAQWSVVDATGGRSVDGFDFEPVTEARHD
jgi:hypothetical protein